MSKQWLPDGAWKWTRFKFAKPIGSIPWPIKFANRQKWNTKKKTRETEPKPRLWLPQVARVIIYIMNAIVFSIYILLLVFDSIASGFGYLQSGNNSWIKMSLYQVNHSKITTTWRNSRWFTHWRIALWWYAELDTLLRSTTMQWKHWQNFKNCLTAQIRSASLLARFKVAYCGSNNLWTAKISCPPLYRGVRLRKVSMHVERVDCILNLTGKLTLIHLHGTQFVEVILVHMHGPQLLRRGINKRDRCQLSICNCINGATPFCVVKIARPTLSQFLYSFLLGSGTQQLDAIL